MLRRISSILGFKPHLSADVILSGFEMVHMMRKREARHAYNPALSFPRAVRNSSRLIDRQYGSRIKILGLRQNLSAKCSTRSVIRCDRGVVGRCRRFILVPGRRSRLVSGADAVWSATTKMRVDVSRAMILVAMGENPPMPKRSSLFFQATSDNDQGSAWPTACWIFRNTSSSGSYTFTWALSEK